MRCINIQPIYEFLQKEASPQEIADHLEGIEIQYVSYLLQHVDDGIPAEAEHQVYLLRALKKAIQKMIPLAPCDMSTSKRFE